MKTKLFALLTAALLLTGCGSAAGDSAQVSSAEQAANVQQNDASSAADNEEELKYSMRDDVDLPRPAYMEPVEHDTGAYATDTVWSANAKGIDYDPYNIVYYADFICELAYAGDGITAWDMDTVMNTEAMNRKIDRLVNAQIIYPETPVQHDDNDRISFNIENQADEEIMGYPARRVSGTVVTKEDFEHTIHFAAHYYINEKDKAVLVLTFTASEQQEMLDEMNRVADLVLTKAVPDPYYSKPE